MDQSFSTQNLHHLGIVVVVCEEINLIGQIDALMLDTRRKVSVGQTVQAIVMIGEGIEANIDKWAFYPFGGEQPVCIANSFALMEAPLVLVTAASQYRLELAPNANVVPDALITLYPKYGLPMIARQRKQVTEPTFSRSFAHAAG